MSTKKVLSPLAARIALFVAAVPFVLIAVICMEYHGIWREHEAVRMAGNMYLLSLGLAFVYLLGFASLCEKLWTLAFRKNARQRYQDWSQY
jgi:hypothetical protein